MYCISKCIEASFNIVSVPVNIKTGLLFISKIIICFFHLLKPKKKKIGKIYLKMCIKLP